MMADGNDYCSGGKRLQRLSINKTTRVLSISTRSLHDKCYQLLLGPRAQRDLDKLRGATWERVREALLTLAHTPRPKGYVKLSTGVWRIRVGEFRVLYDIDDKAKTVEVLRIGRRRDIYRQV